MCGLCNNETPPISKYIHPNSKLFISIAKEYIGSNPCKIQIRKVQKVLYTNPSYFTTFDDYILRELRLNYINYNDRTLRQKTGLKQRKAFTIKIALLDKTTMDTIYKFKSMNQAAIFLNCSTKAVQSALKKQHILLKKFKVIRILNDNINH